MVQLNVAHGRLMEEILKDAGKAVGAVILRKEEHSSQKGGAKFTKF